MKRRCEDCENVKEDVENTKADLMLCQDCTKVRWPHDFPNTGATSSSSSSSGATPPNAGATSGSRTTTPNAGATTNSSKTTPTTIQKLTDILKIGRNDIVKVYTKCLSTVHQYAQQDIHECLMKMDLDILNNLHKALCDCVTHILPQFKDRRIVNRQVKRTVVPDIISLGYSLINKAADKDLDKIFLNRDPPNTEGNDQLTNAQLNELLELLVTVADLGSRVGELEKKLRNVNAENQSLSNRIVMLEQSNKADVHVTNQEHEAPKDNEDEVPSSDSTNAEEVASDSEEITPNDAMDDHEDDDVIITAVFKSSNVTDRSADTSESEVSGDSSSENLDSDDENNYVFPRRYRQKVRKLEKKASNAKQAKKGGTQNSRANKDGLKTLKASVGNTTTKHSDVNHGKPSKLRATVRTNTKDIYIGKVSSNNSAKDIVAHMNDMGINVSGKVYRLAQGPTHQSFRVSVPSESYSTALHGDNWPKGLIVRPFRTSGHNQRPFRTTGHNHRPFRPRNQQHEDNPRQSRISSQRKNNSRQHHNKNQQWGHRNHRSYQDPSIPSWRLRSNQRINSHSYGYSDFNSRQDEWELPNQYSDYDHRYSEPEW
jgi:hypothetical protein